MNIRQVLHKDTPINNIMLGSNDDQYMVYEVKFGNNVTYYDIPHDLFMMEDNSICPSDGTKMYIKSQLFKDGKFVLMDQNTYLLSCSNRRHDAYEYFYGLDYIPFYVDIFGEKPTMDIYDFVVICYFMGIIDTQFQFDLDRNVMDKYAHLFAMNESNVVDMLCHTTCYNIVREALTRGLITIDHYTLDGRKDHIYARLFVDGVIEYTDVVKRCGTNADKYIEELKKNPATVWP